MTSERILAAASRSTWVLVIVLIAGVMTPGRLGGVVAAVALVMFFAGIVLMGAAFLIGLRRSRTEMVTVPGLFLLQGCAPRSVRRALLGYFAAQSVVSIAAAALQLYTLVAFGVLAPTFALGLAGLWAAKYGDFGPRESTPS